MSAIQRSKSAPTVAPPQPFLASHGSDDVIRTSRPRVVRHKTSLALTELATPRSAPRSGYRTPHAERVEDPFSLGGFFPSHLPGTESPAQEWNWLKDDEIEAVEAQAAQNDEWSERALPPTAFDKAEDEEAARVIRREDKLGVLSLRTSFRDVVAHSASCLQGLIPPGGVFSSREAVFSSAYDDHLLTPYSEDLPEDSDALYQSYCDLRRAHTSRTMAIPGTNSKTEDGPGRLFSPSPDESELEGEQWQSVFSAGLGRILDMISL